LILDPPPHRLPRLDSEINRLAAHNLPVLLRHWYPVEWLEEEGLKQDDASNDRIFVGRWSRAQVAIDASAHLSETTRAVLLAEGIPGKARRQAGPMREEAAAHDGIVRAVELEEEWFSDVEPSKSAAGQVSEFL
jgi:hypothetical protein